jgi:hypothetical protein
MRQDLQAAWDAAKKTDGTIYKNPEPSEIEVKLEPTERVISLLKCLKAEGNLGGGQVATAVLTDKKVHLFSRGMMKSKTSSYEVVPFSMITGIQVSRKIASGWKIEMTRAANSDTLLKCNEAEVQLFAEELKKLVAQSQQGGQTVVQNAVIDPLDQLKKLKELLDAGVVTQEEFEEKKKSLMGQI